MQSTPIKVESDTLVEQIVRCVRERLPREQAVLVSSFVKSFYASVSETELRARRVEDLYGAMLSFWNFVSVRQPDETKVRVYNPDFERDGWQSKYTIVEIVADGIPFVVDSVRMALNRRGYIVDLTYPMSIGAERDKEGNIVGLDTPGKNISSETVLYIEMVRQSDVEELESLTQELEQVLTSVQHTVNNWQPILGKVEESIEELDAVGNISLEHGDPINEIREFLTWLRKNHFTFLGYREFDVVKKDGRKCMAHRAESDLGILLSSHFTQGMQYSDEPKERLDELDERPGLLVLFKTTHRSDVHRPCYIDCVSVKRINDKGELIGERQFWGIYTSTALAMSPRTIPVIRRKLAYVLERSGFPVNSHSSKDLLHILENYPSDELFQASREELFNSSLGVLNLQERQRVWVHLRQGIYKCFFYVTVFVPRERFSTSLRQKIQALLKKRLKGEEVEFELFLSESVLARIYLLIRTKPGLELQCDVDALRHDIVAATRTWSEDLSDALLDAYGDERGYKLIKKYGDAFPAGYRENFSAVTAVSDIDYIEGVFESKTLGLSIYRSLEQSSDEGLFHFKIFQHEGIILSDVLPILENMGLRVIEEKPYRIMAGADQVVWVHDFSAKLAVDTAAPIEESRDLFQEAFTNIWYGRAESDGFNRLTLAAGLGWRQVVVLRAYSKYVWQIDSTFSQQTVEDAFADNPHIAVMLWALFETRFSLELEGKKRSQASSTHANALCDALDAVVNLDQDRILRRVRDVILATVRTNYYQVEDSGLLKNYLSFKFDPFSIPDMPLPRPTYEIFVYAPCVEGVHLRGGKVARGGLRWSDRRDDYRTEILGLVKAQQVKNSVIVPVGAKGGFVAKCLPKDGSRKEVFEEVQKSYRTFIRGLLDLTDNMVNGEVQPPENVYRYDDDDPYLVVAADKGTATFSDVANQIAMDYQFWLGDAFASGGQQGYDHKKMGITARGAWVSVERHFRELGLNTRREPFTVIGIGDMAGDVFGNGLLLSPCIRLVAAFNHLHIFVDPKPNEKKSFDERKRLFEAPGSSWSDYDESLISKGGGVFKRSAKSIAISAEMKEALGIEEDKLVPNDLIRAILKAPVDLLWNGGIGTFVKSRHESHADVGDRVNDNLRINANELKTRVVGEGGNLGMTQLARVEYDLAGGRVYSDFIDNVGGVDCSDNEVNIKILLNDVMEQGELTEKQRNDLLADMTEEVADIVLRHNYQQTQAVSLMAETTHVHFNLYRRFMQFLEKEGFLDRGLEALPSEEQLDERRSANKGFSRSELSVLLAYSKNVLKQRLLLSDLPDDRFFQRHLINAFPQPLRKKYAKQIERHSLRREIIATQLSNEVNNEMGFTFVYRIEQETGADLKDIIRCYEVAREVFALPVVMRQIEALDNVVSSAVQMEMMIDLNRLVRRSVKWMIRDWQSGFDIGKMIQSLAPSAKVLQENITHWLKAAELRKQESHTRRLMQAGVPKELAHVIAICPAMYSLMNIVKACEHTNLPVEKVGEVYFALDAQLELHWFRVRINSLQPANHWQSLARGVFQDEVERYLSSLVTGVLLTVDGDDVIKCVNDWLQQNVDIVGRWKNILHELKGCKQYEPAMFSVALRELLALLQRGTTACVM